MCVTPPDWTRELVADDTANWLQRLYESGEQSDCVVRCGSRDFSVHKNIISACPFFAAALKHDFQEKKQGVIVLDDDDVTSVELLLKQLYGFRFSIDPTQDPAVFLESCKAYAIGCKYGNTTLQCLALYVVGESLRGWQIDESTPNAAFFEGLRQIYLHKGVGCGDDDFMTRLQHFTRREYPRLMRPTNLAQFLDLTRQCPELAVDLMRDCGILCEGCEYERYSRECIEDEKGNYWCEDCLLEGKKK